MKVKQGELKKNFLIIILLAVLWCIVQILGSIGGTKKLEKKLVNKVEVESWSLNEEILSTSVEMPDYSQIMLSCYEDVQKGFFMDEDKFEKKLYKKTLKNAQDKKAETIRSTVTINLSEQDNELNTKSKKKVEQFIAQYILEKEFEEFCVEILNKGFEEMIHKEAVE